MTDQKQALRERPWTPGPWSLTDEATTVAAGFDWVAGINGSTLEAWRANAHLIALAPEMAEAILQIDHGCAKPSSMCALCAAADKLRGIGERT